MPRRTARTDTRVGAELVGPLLDWYRDRARDLPWRRPTAGPWAVLVSEFMLAQTPVARVLPVYETWLARWPTPQSLAAESPAEAVRAWGKLGYPRRALRLHGSAAAICERFDGVVPPDVDDLRTLPGVGDYTARAVVAFAFGQRAAVVDTNVRRVLARAVIGQGDAGPPSTVRDLRRCEQVLPAQPPVAARFSIALMELGALVCTARTPRCSGCPIRSHCAWQRAGAPPYTGPHARRQRFAGTDRQVRGLLLDVLRATAEPVPKAALDRTWSDSAQRERALDGLIADGLIEPLAADRFALPSGQRPRGPL